MDPVTLVAITNALIAAEPAIEKMIKAVVAAFAEQHGLDAVAIVRQITPDRHAEVDAIVDAEITTRTWPQR